MLDIGVKEKKSMNEKIKYTDGPNMDGAKIIKDFLPPPDKLILNKNVLSNNRTLLKRSIDFIHGKVNKTKNKLSKQTPGSYSTASV